MPGISLGELFVSLGFDVDEKKLKSFDETLKSAYETGLKIVGIGGGVAGFITLAKGAEQTALQLRNLTTVFGVNAQAAQAWAAAVHENNPLISYSQGIESFGKISQYFASAAFQGKGAQALNRLGVGFSTDDIQHPERMINKLFEQIPRLLTQHPENRALYSSLVGDITGDAANIGIFERGKSFQDYAGSHAALLQKELDDTVRMAENIAAVENQWDHFYKKMMADLAGGGLDVVKNIKEQGFLAGIGQSLVDLGAADPYGLKSKGNWLLNNGMMANARAGAFNMMEGGAAGNRADAITFWQAHGYSSPQIAAWLAQENSESGFNPRARNGKYSGLFQWSPDRAAAILKGTGIDIGTANHWQQLQAAEWEFRQMGLDKNFRGIGNSGDASKFLSDRFEIHERFNASHGDEAAYRARMAEQMERPVEVHLHQTIHSNADAEEVARISHEGMRGAVLKAYMDQIGVTQ